MSQNWLQPSFENSRPPFAQRTPRSKARAAIRWREPLLLAGATVLALVPFLDKAFHIDDTLFLAAARQIRMRPLDFYGFAINWHRTALPMTEVMKNPPLTSYFIAAVSAVAGEREIALHLAFLLPAVAAVLGTYALARRLCDSPAAAALVTLSAPVFLVSATNVMGDTMLLAFWVWAVELWARGLETRGFGTLLVASLLAAFAALTKYYGVAIVPLLLVYGLARRRRLGAWALPLLATLAILAAYQAWTGALYGRGLLLDAAAYSGAARTLQRAAVSGKTAVGFSFLGGCFASAAFFLPQLWGRRLLAIGAGAGLLLFAAVFAGWIGPPMLSGPSGTGMALQFALFAVAGAGVLALAAADLVEVRDADSLLLCLWLLGTFAFAILFNWTVNGRSLLPGAPAVGILLMRRLDRRGRAAPIASLAAGIMLALIVAWSDLSVADGARAAASQIARSFAPASRTLWFEGHWGFQHYMEAAGAVPLDVRHSRLKIGDGVVIPQNNTGRFSLAPGAAIPRSVTELAVLPFVATLSHEIGAGFYTDIWGPLPFAFGRVPPERYFLLDVVREVPAGEIAR